MDVQAEFLSGLAAGIISPSRPIQEMSERAVLSPFFWIQGFATLKYLMDCPMISHKKNFPSLSYWRIGPGVIELSLVEEMIAPAS